MNGSNWVPMTLEELKISEGVPTHAKFKGYVVHLIESDEYLAKTKICKGIRTRIWAPSPELAKRYKDHRQAWANTPKNHPKRATVGILWDIGSQYMVSLNEK